MEQLPASQATTLRLTILEGLSLQASTAQLQISPRPCSGPKGRASPPCASSWWERAEVPAGSAVGRPGLAKASEELAVMTAAAPLTPMAPPQLSSNTAPMLALVGAEILSLMAFVGVCEARATDIALCESRWALALPAIALAGQSAATYFMDSGRPGPWGPMGPYPDGGAPLRPLPPRNRLGQFRATSSTDDEEDQAA